MPSSFNIKMLASMLVTMVLKTLEINSVTNQNGKSIFEVYKDAEVPRSWTNELRIIVKKLILHFLQHHMI